MEQAAELKARDAHIADRQNDGVAIAALKARTLADVVYHDGSGRSGVKDTDSQSVSHVSKCNAVSEADTTMPDSFHSTIFNSKLIFFVSQ